VRGGEGAWLRIMKFVPAENKIYVSTFSPTRDAFLNDPENMFELHYDMSEAATRDVEGRGVGP